MAFQPRLILLHKQKTSGRVRYLCLPHGVLAFTPLPVLSALRDEDFTSSLNFHPAALLQEAESRLGLAAGSLEAEAEFQAWVDTPEGDVPILLGAFTTIDPPFAEVEKVGGRFIALTEARALSEVERNLLRRTYEHVLG